MMIMATAVTNPMTDINVVDIGIKTDQMMKNLRDKDQLAATNEAERTKTKVDTLNTNVAALQAVNAELKGTERER